MADNYARVAEIAAHADRDGGLTDADLAQHRATRPNRAKSQMISVRIPVESFDELEQLARKIDVPLSALVRGYILRGMAEQTGSLSQSLDRVAAEVAKLQRIVGS